VPVEIEGCEDLLFKGHAAAAFLTAGWNSSTLPYITICRQCLRDKCVDVRTIRRWVLQFKQELGEASGFGDGGGRACLRTEFKNFLKFGKCALMKLEEIM
jgi:hypothetical protein